MNKKGTAITQICLLAIVIIIMAWALTIQPAKASSDSICIKIGESPLTYPDNNVTWSCENITIPREMDFEGDYSYYKLNCLAESVEVYKCL